MTITIDIPEDFVQRLEKKWGNLPRRALEALTIEAYRDKVLSAAEVGQLLDHSSRWETEPFLLEREAYFPINSEDVKRDAQAARKVTNR